MKLTQRLSGASLLVFANKTDINGCMDEMEIQEVCSCRSDGNKRARANKQLAKRLRLPAIRTNKWHIIRCSAITGMNLKEGLAWVVEDAKARLFLF